MRNYIFDADAFDEFSDWAQKICELLKETRRTPFEGKGKPEPLQYKLFGCWSRRIDEKHRLVYKMTESGDIFILSCKGHYDDK